MNKQWVIPVLTAGLKIASTPQELKQVGGFRTQQYKKYFPQLSSCSIDDYDKHACILYRHNAKGEITSSARVVLDSLLGLPSEDLLKAQIGTLRDQKIELAEVGRFMISDESDSPALVKAYYRAFYQIAVANDIDSMVIIVKNKDRLFHQRIIGERLLAEDMGHLLGSKHPFVSFDWRLNETLPKFFKWTGLPQTTLPSIWDKYARSHASVMTSMQLALYQEASKYLSGEVIDCGCGTAKLGALLSGNDNVTEYTGVDLAEGMVEIASYLLGKLANPHYRVKLGKIEEADGLYQSAVSIHSYYAWPDPLKILAHIYKILQPGAIFVLATPNPKLDMPRLIDSSRLELLAHPDYDEFEAFNLKLASDASWHFVSMSVIIAQALQTGFEVVTCHQQHFLGGVNFLVLQKQ